MQQILKFENGRESRLLVFGTNGGSGMHDLRGRKGEIWEIMTVEIFCKKGAAREMGQQTSKQKRKDLF